MLFSLLGQRVISPPLSNIKKIKALCPLKKMNNKTLEQELSEVLSKNSKDALCSRFKLTPPVEKIVHDGISFTWFDSNTLIKVKDDLIPAGTCIKIQNTIIFLEPLEVDDLKLLKNIVNEAIKYELNKRKNT